jgi:uncharacterized membrane protein YccC
MSRAANMRLVLGHWGLTPAALHHGAQVAAAVVMGYFLAVALGLPERFWVVITILIVMRADSGSTMDAGWERVRGTLIGALSGLLGVYLQHLGANATAVTLSIISLLAFASAALPLLRSAAVAALIVLGAGELAGYSILHVALMRVMQIGLGVGVSVALTLLTSRFSTAARLKTGCAALLGRLSMQMQTHGTRARSSESQVEAAATAVRSALAGLATLAGSADRAFPWSRPPAVPLQARHYRNMAALTTRIVQDSAMLKRILNLLGDSNAQPAAQEAAHTAGTALRNVASTITGNGPASLDELRQLTERYAAQASAGPALLLAPLRLLLDDLQQLSASQAEGVAPRALT